MAKAAITSISTAIITALLLGLSGCAKDPSDAELPHGAPSASIPVSSMPADLRHAPVPEADAESYVVGSELLAAKHANLLALSPEEAAWLDRNGYPTPGELASLQTYDIRELENAMRNRRDPKSAALLGHRLQLEGDLRGALAAFSQGAHLGSMYSQQQLALVSVQRATGLAANEIAKADQGSLGVMVARLEVARMLGDHRAQTLIDRYAANFHWKHYGKHVVTQTAIFMDQYGEYARARGERAKGPDPRPNADAWIALQEDPSSLVKVYTRGRGYP